MAKRSYGKRKVAKIVFAIEVLKREIHAAVWIKEHRMNWKSKVSRMLFAAFGAGIGVALIAGYNIKMAKKYGTIEEEKERVVFSDGANKDAIGERKMPVVKVKSQIAEKQTVMELMERLSGTQWDSKYESKIDTGTYYKMKKMELL